MRATQKTPFEPEKLPRKKLKKSIFNKELVKAKLSIYHFQKLLDSIPKSKKLFSSLLAVEALAALESQKIDLSLEDFFILNLTQSHLNKKLLQPIYYYLAFKNAFKSIKTDNLTKKNLCSIHKMVKKGSSKHMELGKYRTKQNWIGPEGCKKEEARFFPPCPEKINCFMQNLFDFLKKEEADPLIQVAIAIAQFLIIHPFRDGNGRIARILIPILFYKKGVLSHPLLFYSRYLKDHRSIYFQKLFDITGKCKWEEWIGFFLKGITHQIQSESKRIENIHRLYLKLNKKLAPHFSSLTFLSYLFSHPVFSRRLFIKRFSRKMMKDLKELKIIKPFKNNYYTFPALLRIIKK
jgi:Fic family protein